MTPEQLADLKDDATLRKRLAKKIAHDCFRNTKELEDMHAFGQISDPEMKLLMIEAVDRTYDLLMDLCSPQGAEIMDDLKQRDQVPEWNDPEPMIFRHLGRPSKSRMENRLPRVTLKAGRKEGSKAGPEGNLCDPCHRIARASLPIRMEWA